MVMGQFVYAVVATLHNDNNELFKHITAGATIYFTVRILKRCRTIKMKVSWYQVA